MLPPTAPPVPLKLDLLVAGLGPGGTAAALAARRLGLRTLAVEARGPEATRSQLVLVRPGARAALAWVGIADVTDGRRTTTIRRVEMRLRAALADPAEPALPHRWHTSVVALDNAPGRVLATLRDEATGALQQVEARHLVDATGGRLEALGRPARQRVGPSHWVMTAEYPAPPWFDGIVGLRDRSTRDLCLLFPTWGRQGVIVYLDSLPGGDGAGLAPRFEALAARLKLGEPLHPGWAVDVVQRLLPLAGEGRVLPIGDSVGSVDVLTGNGMSTAIEDAVQAVQGLAAAQRAPDADAEDALTRRVHAVVLARHRRAMWRGRVILGLRPVLERCWPATAPAAMDRASAGPPPLLWPMVRFVFGKRPQRGAGS